MRPNLKFDVTIDGDTLAGTPGAGVLPASKVTGARAVALKAVLPEAAAELTGDDTVGAYAFIDMHVPPGGGPEPHAHGFEEMFYVLEGEIDVFFDDECITAGASAAVNIPAWAPHMFKNLNTVPARLFTVVATAGLEAMFAEIGKQVETRVTLAPSLTQAEQAAVGKDMPAITERYRAHLLPRDTFDHLMPHPPA